MEIWKYRVISISAADVGSVEHSVLLQRISTDLDALGQDGWELVSADLATTLMNGRRAVNLQGVLKRPLGG